MWSLKKHLTLKIQKNPPTVLDSRPGVNKLQPMSQIQSATCLYSAHKLRTDFTDEYQQSIWWQGTKLWTPIKWNVVSPIVPLPKSRIAFFSLDLYHRKRCSCCLVTTLCASFVTPQPVAWQALWDFSGKTLERVAISFSTGSSQHRDRTWVSCMGRRIL